MKGKFIFAMAVLFIAGCSGNNTQTSIVKPDLLFYRNTAGIKKPVSTQAEWAQKRGQILEGMQQAMGQLPDRSALPALDIEISDSLKGNNYTRLSISFAVAENERVPAYLYVPHSEDKMKKHPAMLALHQTGASGKELVDGQDAYAKELAQRGYVVIAPDYPGFGDLKDYDFENDQYQSGTMKGIFNHMRCVDLLRDREDVDGERIGVIGHSLGGHNAMFVGAFDTRLKVIVSSCGWTLMDYYNIGEEATKKYGGRLGPWAQRHYMPLLKEKYNLDAELIPFDFDAIIAALAPRAFFSNSPLKDSNFEVEGVKEGIAAASKVYGFLGAENKLEILYPNAGHDFPLEVRQEAYFFLDKIFEHNSNIPENK